MLQYSLAPPNEEGMLFNASNPNRGASGFGDQATTSGYLTRSFETPCPVVTGLISTSIICSRSVKYSVGSLSYADVHGDHLDDIAIVVDRDWADRGVRDVARFLNEQSFCNKGRCLRKSVDR